jgi:hypothetical protein
LLDRTGVKTGLFDGSDDRSLNTSAHHHTAQEHDDGHHGGGHEQEDELLTL